MSRNRDEYRSKRSNPTAGVGGMPKIYSPTEEPFESSYHRPSAGSGGYYSSGYDYQHVPPPRPSHPPRPQHRSSFKELTYTYDDEEPETIDIAPAWNGYKKSATREELKKYFIGRGMDKETVESELNKEFEARAPKYKGEYSESRTPEPEPESRKPHRSEHEPSSSKPESTRKEPPIRSKEYGIKFYMDKYGYSREEAEDLVRLNEKKARDKGKEAGGSSTPKERKHNEPSSKTRSSRSESTPKEPIRSKEHGTTIYVIVDKHSRGKGDAEAKKAKGKGKAAENSRRPKERKHDESSARRRSDSKEPTRSIFPHTFSPHEKLASSTSSAPSRPYLLDHAKAYRIVKISFEEWKRIWMKPHLDRGKTREEAHRRAEKDLMDDMCRFSKNKFIGSGLLEKEAEKKLDRLYSRPPRQYN